MKRLILLLVSIPLVAQVTVTKAQVTVTAVAGATTCVAISPSTPNINVQCTTSGSPNKSVLTGPITIGSGSGTAYSYNTVDGGISFLFSVVNGTSPVNYQVTSAPTAGCPVGAACTASGTF